MSTVQFQTAFLLLLTLLIAVGAVSEGDCKYYAKKTKAKTMECYLKMGNQDPVCKAGGSSSENCRIEVRGEEMCIKWLKSSEILCQNETHLEDMEGTSQDCAADQASPQNSTPTNKADLMVVLLSLVLICIWFAVC